LHRSPAPDGGLLVFAWRIRRRCGLSPGRGVQGWTTNISTAYLSALLTIFVLLYLNFRRLTETLIVLLSVPLALVGGV
jgi:hypothetical protein